MKSLLCFAILCSFGIVSGESQKNQHETKVPLENLETRLNAMEENLRSLTKSVNQLVHGAKSETDLDRSPTLIGKTKRILGNEMNDADLEQRVGVLESQMTDVTGDVNDVETQVTLLEADVTLIQADQNTQDTRILALESDKDEVRDAIVGILSEISELKEINATLQTQIQQLKMADTVHDSRLRAQEQDGTISFHVVLTDYYTLPVQSIVNYQSVTFNIGDGYSSETGQFRVPSGGAGLYYFQVNFVTFHGKDAEFDLRRNNVRFARIRSGEITGINKSTSSGGATVELEEGDVVDVFYYGGTDDEPLYADNIYQSNTFSGFRIAPKY